MGRNKTALTFGDKIALKIVGGDEQDDFQEDLDLETGAKVDDEYEDDVIDSHEEIRSTLRTKNAKLLEDIDEKYAGTKTSRRKPKNGYLAYKRDVESDDDDENSLASEDPVEEEEDGDRMSVEESVEDDDEEDEDENSSTYQEEEEGLMSSEELAEDDEGDLQTISSVDKESEMAKGKAIQNQLRMWDALLEVRIKLQKILMESNKLPQDLSRKEYMAPSKHEYFGSLSSTTELLNSLAELHGTLTEQNPETVKSVTAKKRKLSEGSGGNNIPSDEEITSSDDEADKESPIQAKPSAQGPAKKKRILDYESHIQNLFEEFIPYRNETIQKWNDKTQLSFGKQQKKSSHETSTLRQIEQILMDKARLIRRTKIRRSSYKTLGEFSQPDAEPSSEEKDQVDEEVFDDDDFYHQLLRELIDRKTSDVNDPVQLSRHWLELQKLRSKLKRKVDTKASKGRKIRYDVHPKLVNFMAPQEIFSMSESATKELMNSLFGKLNQ